MNKENASKLWKLIQEAGLYLLGLKRSQDWVIFFSNIHLNLYFYTLIKQNNQHVGQASVASDSASASDFDFWSALSLSE